MDLDTYRKVVRRGDHIWKVPTVEDRVALSVDQFLMSRALSRRYDRVFVTMFVDSSAASTPGALDAIEKLGYVPYHRTSPDVLAKWNYEHAAVGVYSLMFFPKHIMASEISEATGFAVATTDPPTTTTTTT